jgi:rSAM/selenodomain-associated transferase 2
MLSIIIPVLNEEKALPGTLEVLFEQVDGEEIIVVDGGSTDRTQDICQRYPDIRFIRSEKGRAKQLNTGAEHANGDALLFLHADTLLPKNALESIDIQLNVKHHRAGGFKHSFGGHDWRLRFISYLDNRRCQQTRVIYGDQAMFIERSLFVQLGQFPDVEIMEDIYFCERLIKHSMPVIIEQAVTTDPRKFVKMGIWRSLLRVIIIQIRNELNMPVANDHPFFAEIR